MTRSASVENLAVSELTLVASQRVGLGSCRTLSVSLPTQK